MEIDILHKNNYYMVIDKLGGEMVEGKNLVFKVENKLILDNLNFKVEKGEKLLLSNKSGSGKTSLLKLILGFQKITSGEIFVDNISVNRKNIESIRKKISYMSQNQCFPNMTVLELFKFIFSFEENKHIDYMENFEKYMKSLCLTKVVYNEKVENLSGGEKQRIAFVINLILDRDIWLLDEPSASVDFEMKKIIEKYIVESNKTVLLISHDKHWDLEKFRVIKW